MTVYVLDTNVFIEAKEDHYGFDICPAFWEWLDIQNLAGKVASIKEVLDELLVGDDELAEWANERCGDYFINPDDDVVERISASVTGRTAKITNETPGHLFERSRFLAGRIRL